MPLQSQLFRGDRALEACLVDDRAHLVTGTREQRLFEGSQPDSRLESPRCLTPEDVLRVRWLQDAS